MVYGAPSQGTSAPVGFELWASSGLSDQRTERRRDGVDATSAGSRFLGGSRRHSPALTHVGQRPLSTPEHPKVYPRNVLETSPVQVKSHFCK